MLVLTALLLAGHGPAYAVVTEEVEAPDPDDKPLRLRLWLPDGLGANLTEATNRLPLVVISHGTGAPLTAHADTARALADAGFVVAAVLHTGDNYRDQSYVRTGQHLSGRPRHVARTIDYMLRTWRAHARLDPHRVGLFGFSAGGFTALVLAGGVPDMTLGVQHCREEPDAWDCEYLRKNGVRLGQQEVAPPGAWLHDRRIRAAVIAAPAVAYSFTSHGLANVTIPIQLWVGGRDDIVGPVAATVVDLLPVPPEYHYVEHAGHFSFLAPCGWGLKSAISVLHLLNLSEDACVDPEGFDRVAFKQWFNASTVQFFQQHLLPASAPLRRS